MRIFKKSRCVFSKKVDAYFQKNKPMNPIKAKYLEAISKLCPQMTKEELAYMEAAMHIVELPNKHFYIQGGETQKNIIA
jgi:hypothetical protein